MTSARRRSPRWPLAAPLVVLAVVFTAGLLRARMEPSVPVPEAAASAPAPTPTPTPTPISTPVRTEPRTAGAAEDKPRTRLVRLPAQGSGRFGYAGGRSKVLGSR
ncbi:hypothetical protein AB0M20_21455, partial [Actinoplanes sp. NPDC051633]